MRLLFTFFMSAAMLFCNEAKAQDFETASTAVKNMGVGWNLGNTLDAFNQSVTDVSSSAYWGQQGLESENYWGQPTTKPELMAMMKNAGFSAIRVPVTWFNHMDSEGNVDAAWMARVKEVVDCVLEQGLYCIINVHHDTGANSDETKHWLHASGTSYTSNKNRYENLWRQIATQFKDYGEKLLFESYNEMLDDYSSWCFASFATSSNYNSSVATDAYNAINNYAQSFVNVVRGTGGNNTKRNLIVNTYGACNGGGNWNSHLQDPLKEMKKPTGESNHIIFEVHSYPNISNLSNAKNEVDEMFSSINQHLVSKGAPVIIGEWGTSNVDNGSDYNNNRANMILFLDYFVKKAKEFNYATFYWMGLSDGSSRSLPVFNQPDLAEAIVKAYHGNTDGYVYPKRGDYETVYDVTFNNQWSELNLINGSISTSNYKGLELELEEQPATGAFQFKAYPSNITQPIATAKSTFTFTSAMGSTINRITLQSCQAGNSTVVKKAYLIRKDGTKEEAEISAFWGCTVSERIATGTTPIFTTNDNADQRIFNLRGQQVSTPLPGGIYIKNGKKYIMR